SRGRRVTRLHPVAHSPDQNPKNEATAAAPESRDDPQSSKNEATAAAEFEERSHRGRPVLRSGSSKFEERSHRALASLDVQPGFGGTKRMDQDRVLWSVGPLRSRLGDQGKGVRPTWTTSASAATAPRPSRPALAENRAIDQNGG